MKSYKVYIDNACYDNLLDKMDQQHRDDQYGNFLDLTVFYNDRWLLDSAVIDIIVPKRGNWEIFLVFAYFKYPLKLIIRKITSCISLKKAQITADFMRRQAAKDQRGTLKVVESDFSHCHN